MSRNPYMVGHTGVMSAAVAGRRGTDLSINQILAAVERAGGVALITADHGNCEMMFDPATGQPHTAHTTNPVPLILAGSGNESASARGALENVGPTMLDILGSKKPEAMTASTLLIERCSGHDRASILVRHERLRQPPQRAQGWIYSEQSLPADNEQVEQLASRLVDSAPPPSMLDPSPPALPQPVSSPGGWDRAGPLGRLARDQLRQTGKGRHSPCCERPRASSMRAGTAIRPFVVSRRRIVRGRCLAESQGFAARSVAPERQSLGTGDRFAWHRDPHSSDSVARPSPGRRAQLRSGQCRDQYLRPAGGALDSHTLDRHDALHVLI